MINRRFPPLRALQAFEVAARKLSFTRAAEELCVSPSAISHQIKELEVFLGEALFVRNGRDVKLSKLGKQYYQEIQKAFGLVESATKNVLVEQTTTIRLAVYGAIAQKWLLKRLTEFYRLHPEIDLQIILMTADPELSDQIADAFITSTPSKRGYDDIIILQEHYVAVCHPAILQGRNPAELGRDLWDLPIITNLNEPLGSDWQDWSSAIGLPLPVPLTIRFRYFSHQILVIEAALLGLGVALCNNFLVKDQLASGQLITLPYPAFNTGLHYYLCIKQSRLREDGLHKFSRWLQKTVATEVQQV